MNFNDIIQALYNAAQAQQVAGQEWSNPAVAQARRLAEAASMRNSLAVGPFSRLPPEQQPQWRGGQWYKPDGTLDAPTHWDY